MANKIIQTRIKNRFDTLTNWEKTGVELLPGEIALVSVTTKKTDDHGNITNIPAVLMKVGEEGKTFSQLPWLSAVAADVYDWAKKEHTKDVEVIVDGNKTTLGDLFTAVTDNDADIADIYDQLEALNGTDSGEGSIAERIKAAIEALDQTNSDPAEGSNLIVKTVKQTDGKVTVIYGSITEAELPNISASKIKVDASTTLDTKLSDLDSAIAAIPGNFSFSADNSDTGVVKSISYDNNGNFTATRSTVDTAEITNAAVTTDKIADSNVTTAKIADSNVTDAKIDTVSASKVIVTPTSGSTAAVTLPTKLSDLDSEIESIKEAIAGGVHFRGVVNADPTTATSLTIDNKSYTPDAGDVVIYDGKEYIYTGSAWEQLGDVSRIGALETTLNNLDVTTENDVANTNMFVSQVTQENGKISVTYTRPTAANISYESSNVEDELVDLASRAGALEDKLGGVTDTVIASITDAINNLDVAEPDASGTSTSFIATAKQEDGKIVVTKANLPEATTSVKGIVSLSSATNSEAENVAATPKAVKAAYDAGTDAQSRVSEVEEKYVRMEQVTGKTDTYTMHMGGTDTDVIIFDCGGAQ